ncbi:hypothetical protein JNUCC1_02559 [Lentibacillus sp. JNUCC-1]|uniref:GNAT family N-acetyltransferase n=1 Tax=Lentibacillus sp. JNUCC-1 TaxID=2654513 RepID=UPI0012E791A1|nr:GNAT family N-acetyltransferase [Lentibacillus sp. JNUCC-1]MUV38705.1 hypothetical protein [Lentibacillus sp. JNUCC-1]
MLKKRELHEVPGLYDLMAHPAVFPYVRHKAYSSDELYFLTKQTIEAEAAGTMISRTITDDYLQPIGTINLFDVENNAGFLATWIGEPYFGQGYNKLAKELFLSELFTELGIETVFMKIRRTNVRSAKAAAKLPYAVPANHLYPDVYKAINEREDVYDLFAITKTAYAVCTNAQMETAVTGDEEVS